MVLVVAFFPAIPPLIHPYTCQEACQIECTSKMDYPKFECNAPCIWQMHHTPPPRHTHTHTHTHTHARTHARTHTHILQ